MVRASPSKDDVHVMRATIREKEKKAHDAMRVHMCVQPCWIISPDHNPAVIYNQLSFP